MGGAVTVYYADSQPGFSRHFEARFFSWPRNETPAWAWLPQWRSDPIGFLGVSGVIDTLTIPLWIPLLLLATPTTFLLLRDRRNPANSCPHCSYPLSRLPPDSTCPECGKRATS